MGALNGSNFAAARSDQERLAMGETMERILSDFSELQPVVLSVSYTHLTLPTILLV